MPNKKKSTKPSWSSYLGPKSNLLLVVYLAILFVGFFKVYSNVFDSKIYLGGDNASYYILGNAIATGQGYTNIHMKEKTSHNHFPPGYPLIIAAASKLYTNDIIFLKRLNGFFLLLTIGLLFLVVFKFTKNYHIAFIVCFFTLFNINLLGYSFIMMSEIPFLFFSLLSLWLFMKTDFSKTLFNNWLFLVLLVSISFTYHIRSTGLSLFFGIAMYLLFEKKWKYLASFVVGFILLALPWYLRGKALGGNAYMSQLILKNPYRPELGQMEGFDWVLRVWNNLERYITREIPSGTFNFIEMVNHKIPYATSEWVIGLCIILVMTFGLYRIRRYFFVLLFYIIGTFAILLLWPDVWFGIRFILPLIPILTFLTIYGIVEIILLFGHRVLKLKNSNIIYLSVVAFTLAVMGLYSKPLEKLEKQKVGIFTNNYQNYFELAKWVNQNTSDTSVTCCRKPQLFHLYSRKYVTGIRTTVNEEEQIEYLKSRGVDYVVLEQLGYSATGRNLYPAMKKYPAKFKLVKKIKDPDTRLMQFLPELDYSGEWKDGKRNGIGTYAWKNGTKFRGEWKDNKRNGKGTLKLEDGSEMDGVWTDDILEGKVIERSPEGDTTRILLYKNNIMVGVLSGKK